MKGVTVPQEGLARQAGEQTYLSAQQYEARDEDGLSYCCKR